MTTTVIDALLVTLGLDPRKFIKGADEANKAQKSIAKEALATERTTEAVERSQANARRSRTREMEDSAKNLSRGLVNLRNEALGFLAIFTLGKGIKDFIGDTINSAANLGMLSANLSMSTTDLTAWQRAATRAGGSADGMTAQLKESAGAIAALKTGLGPNDGMQWFFRMGGSSKDLKDGNTYLLARAKIVSDLFAIDPSKAALVASQMGISDDQFNLIKQGPAAILTLVDAQKKNAAVTKEDAAAALVLRNRWLDFRDSLQATATKVLVAMIPAFEQFVGWLQKGTDWITNNKDAIGKWVSDMVSKALPVLDNIGRAIAGVDWDAAANGAKTVGSAIVDLASSVSDLLAIWKKWTGREDPTPGVTKLPGAVRFGKSDDLDTDDAKNGRKAKPKAPKATGVLADVSNGIEEAVARTLASFGNRAAGEWVRDNTGRDDYNVGPKVDKKSGDAVLKQLMDSGWSKPQATGLLANFNRESGLNPRAVGDNGQAVGIGQWHPDRQADFKKLFGKTLIDASLSEQVMFADYELSQGKEQPAGRKLGATKTAAEAAAVLSRTYFRPADADGEATKRAKAATSLDVEQRAAAAPQVPTKRIEAAATATTAQRAANAAAAAKMPTHTVPQKVSSAPTVTTDVQIGAITINTQATDATSIARELPGELKKHGFSFVTQANTGIV